MTDAPETLLEREEVTEPGKRWRNKMRAKEGITFRDYSYEAGDLFQAGELYPSKDAAETAAIDFLSEALDPPRDDEILAGVSSSRAFPGARGDGNVIYEADMTVDDDGELIAVCPECEGSGKGDTVYEPDDYGVVARRDDCPVCCGFGRLDW